MFFLAFINESSVNPNDALFAVLISGKFRNLPRPKQISLVEKSKAYTLQKEKNLEQNFTSKESDALDNYVSVNYRVINPALRNGTPLSSKNQKIVDLIDTAITKSKLKQELVIYRSSNNFLVDEAFSSASIDPYVAYNFHRGDSKISRFVIPSGTNYVYIGGGEKEILLGRTFNLSKYLDNK
jgi:hypothetical protein